MINEKIKLPNMKELMDMAEDMKRLCDEADRLSLPFDPDEYDDSKDIKRGNNQAGRDYMERRLDQADLDRKEGRGE